ncbi:3-dehydro-L-gulonate 2-dehydrogenase [Halomonas binhaiensis]|uniref:3-dehydro-L-gulonate 2-dehydrogenase n=1 Tax=Halomonas binhaiensis TaxID=2562282 RepID=A0A5C1NJY9_9GAMM|nr:3-dehydro-L-gulonate 2-dehydrogenase [Halomonas binhaiensis]QEM83606.1 3-dehydro-L-gulonate 2-dehydrogenase [Halomonas binhaiensis]
MAEIPFVELEKRLERILRVAGLGAEDAALCARVHAESTRDGVVSHGVGRIPRFIDYLARGWVDPQATLTPITRLDTLEVFDGGQGIGVCHALNATERAMALASQHGMGLVAVRNTTHWMRGGTYGWHAAEQGYAAIMWTNTESCMPAWGARNQSIGNNPLVMAVPSKEGPLVLDMAMSQFSYGKLATLSAAGETLAVDGGFDGQGRLSRDPGVIAATRRLLPTGYWKGSGLAILLDALAALLSQGNASHQIDRIQRGSGTGCSQIFMIFDPRHLGGQEACEALCAGITGHLAASEPDAMGRPVRWPGQATMNHRRHGPDELVQIPDDTWQAVLALPV